MRTKILACTLALFLAALTLAPLTSALSLPAPQSISMNFEQSLFRRVSIREFTHEPVSDQDLSTILYNTMGQRQDGTRTNPGHNGTYSTVLYVLLPDAAYTYSPDNHSLVLYKQGDWRQTVGYQYPNATLVLGLCYNTSLANQNEGGMEIGQICQNIGLTLSGLTLGGVVTGGLPPAINKMGIPSDQKGLIVLPIGHPLHPYTFKNHPLWLSPMARPTEHQYNLTTILDHRHETTNLTGTLTQNQIDQLVWSSYGFSPYLDRSTQTLNYIQRHRTVPSAHAYYPLTIYAITPTSISRYQPNLLKSVGRPADTLGLPILTYLKQITTGDHRADLAAASSLPSLATAPLTLIVTLDTTKTGGTGTNYTQFWYLEAGAAAHTAMLEATALNLQTSLATPTNPTAIQSLLSLTNTQTPVLLLGINGT